MEKRCSVCGGELVRIPYLEIQLPLFYCRKCKAVFYYPKEFENFKDREEVLLQKAFC